MRKFCVALAAVASLACAGDALGAVRTATYTGTLSSGLDTTGIFGAVGADLTGLAFTAVFTLDTDTPGADDVWTSTFAAFSGSGAANPMHGVLTINGQDYLFGTEYGENFAYDDGVGRKAQQAANNVKLEYIDNVQYDNLSNMLAYFTEAGVGLGHPYAEARSIRTPGPGASYFGEFFIQRTTYDFNTDTFYLNEKAEGVFDIASLTVVNPGVVPPDGGASVPEPATWAMLVLGFGGAGVAVRRRRRLATA